MKVQKLSPVFQAPSYTSYSKSAEQSRFNVAAADHSHSVIGCRKSVPVKQPRSRGHGAARLSDRTRVLGQNPYGLHDFVLRYGDHIIHVTFDVLKSHCSRILRPQSVSAS